MHCHKVCDMCIRTVGVNNEERHRAQERNEKDRLRELEVRKRDKKAK